MKASDDAPLLAGLSGAVLSVFVGERLLQTEELQVWQQGAVYLGEVLFGFILADLVWWLGSRALGVKPDDVDRSNRMRMRLYGAGTFLWIIAMIAASRTSPPQGRWAVAGAISLVSIVALATILRRRALAITATADRT